MQTLKLSLHLIGYDTLFSHSEDIALKITLATSYQKSKGSYVTVR